MCPLSALIKGRTQYCASLYQIFRNTFEVKMQAKHDLGKTTLHKMPIY